MPKLDQNYDEADEIRRALEVKQNKLEKYELTGQITTEVSPEESLKQQSFTESLVSKIVDNLQVTIKNIHVRYEDQTSFKGHPLSVGLSLQELSAVSTDSMWNPSFLHDNSPITHKLVTLRALSIYWNSDSQVKQGDSDVIEFMSSVTKQKIEGFQYILQPVTGVGHITLNKLAKDGPSAKAQLIFDDLGFVLDSDQYRDSLSIVEMYNHFMQTKEFMKFRPKTPVEKDPKAWLRYAGNVVLDQISKKNRQWSWNNLLERRNDRLRYIELYKLKNSNPSAFTEIETKEFNLLETKYTFDDLKFFRSLAKSELKKEKAQLKPQVAKSTSWSSWIWGSNPSNKQQIAGEEVSEEQQKEFYEAIEWDEKEAAASAMKGDKDVVTLQVETILKTGSFTLLSDPHGNSKNIMQVSFNGFSSRFYNRADSFLAELSLHELRVDDNVSNTLFKQVISVKSISSDILPEVAHEDCALELSDEAKQEDAFFNLSYEQNPPDGEADSNLFIQMKSITVFYNAFFIENIFKFFKPPKAQSETLGALLNAARASVDEFRDLTRIGLEYALQVHKTLNVKMDIQAPLIVVPLDVTSVTSPCLIFDAGHIGVISHLADKAVKARVEEKKSQQYTDEDWKTLESLMYDKYDVKLHNMQFLVGSNLRDTMKEISAGSGPSSVMDKLNIDFLAEVSIQPEAHNITKFKASGNLPLFSAAISDEKYRILMKIIENSIPNFEFNTPPDTPTNESSFLVGNETYTTLPDLDDFSETSTLAEVKTVDQKLFAFNFTIEKVKLALYRCTDVTTLTQDLLVDMTLSGFDLNADAHTDHMTASASLQAFSIDDHIQKEVTGDVSKIATSNDSSSSKILDLSYKQVKADKVDKFGTEITDRNIKLSLSSLTFVIAPRSILALMDFATTAFASPVDKQSVSPTPEQQLEALPKGPVSEATTNVQVDLHSIVVLLNDDGIKLATLQLDSANVNVALVALRLRVAAQLGQLTLHDEVNEGSPRDSILRELVSIKGDNLADFKYETFDPSSDSPYDSSIYFRTGSLQFNVVEEPLTRLAAFTNKFSRMKALYDSARLAAFKQANQIEDANKIHFDILVSSPIVLIPRLVEHSTEGLCDTVVAHLGDIFAQNEYTKIADDPEGPTVNRIVAGIRSVQLTSDIHFPDGTNQLLKIIDNTDMAFDVSYAEPFSGMKRPETIVSGFISDTNLKLTELQTKFLVDSSSVFSRIASGGDTQENEEEIEELGKELGLQGNLESLGLLQPAPKSHFDVDKINLKFDAKSLALTLYNNTTGMKSEDLENHSLSKFSLNKFTIDMKMKSNGDISAGMKIDSFTLKDIRPVKENKFPEIIPATGGDQLSCRVSLTGEDAKLLRADVNVNSPSMILAIEYLVALKSFADSAMPATVPSEENQIELPVNEADDELILSEASSISTASTPKTAQMTVEFSAKVSNASVILIADPKFADSEAIVFSVASMEASQAEALKVQVSDVGMFLCRMDKFDDNRLRILDNFSITAVMDTRGSDKDSDVAKVNVSCGALVLRLSLREVLLALDIIQKASALSTDSTEVVPVEKAKYSRFTKPSGGKTVATSLTGNSRQQASRRKSSVARRKSSVQTKVSQRLLADFEGLRFVMISTAHELPVLDMFVKPFTVTAQNWTADLLMNAAFETFVNVYNYEKSAWEPLVEPWGCELVASRSGIKTAVSLRSDKMAEVTLTSQTIGIIGRAVNYLSEDVDVLSKPRGETSLYRVINQTGYELEVWSDSNDDTTPKPTVVSKDQEIPWSFIDWHKLRDNLSTDSQKVDLGVKLIGTSYEPIRRVSVSSVGQQVFPLQSPASHSSHRIMCEVVLVDDVKHIIFRSPLKFTNKTKVPVEIGVNIGSANSRILRIEPKQSKSVPVDYAFDHPVYVRPDAQVGFGWSKNPIHWQNFIKGPKAVSCPSDNENNSVSYFYRVSAKYDTVDPRARFNPSMNIVLAPPVEVQNLLPFDISFRIYDKSTGKDWSNTLKQGKKSAIHIVEPSRLLLMSVNPQDSGFSWSEFAVINVPPGNDFTRENKLLARSDDGQKLELRLHYKDDRKKGDFCRVQIYTPYLVLNKTGLDLRIQSKFTTCVSRVQAFSSDDTSMMIGAPKMWSFEGTSTNNRAVIQVGNSKASDALSFDTLGKDSEIALPSTSKASKVHVGLHISEGAGKYRLTKIVTFTPRFIVRNKLHSDIYVKDPESESPILIKPNDLKPLHFLHNSSGKKLIASFSDTTWSAPFAIENIGRNYVRMYKNDTQYTLLQVDILLEDATLYLHIEDASNTWPFSIRNFTNHSFKIYQSNPYVDDQGIEVSHKERFVPIEYLITPKSVMPYAWDFPAAPVKELVVEIDGNERRILLAEIGNLQPLRLNKSEVVDFNVVADGPTQTLVISDYDESMSLYKIDTRASQKNASQNQTQSQPKQEDEGPVSLTCSISMKGLGLSLINDKLQEICYVSVNGFELQYRVSELYETITTKLKWFQIDNQLLGGIFPILLYPSVLKNTRKELEEHPTFSGSITRVRDDSHGVMYIKYATVLLQQLTVQVDEEFLFALIDFVNSYEVAAHKPPNVLCQPQLEIPEPVKDTSGLDFYFEALHIQPAQLDISFMRTTERSSQEEDELEQNSSGALMYIFNILTLALGNINDAPVRLNALLIENVRTPLPLLSQSVATHYKQNFFSQLHMILGSADFLGNPVGLFNNMSSGFMDLFYEPYQGYIVHESPAELGIGIAKGGLSFMKKSIFGISDSVSKFTGSVSKGLTAATLDQSYQQRRSIRRSRNKPSHALTGFSSGANSFIDGIASGISGLALSPLQGAQSGGAGGFFKGLGKGIVGLPTKTAIGILDMATNVSEGVRNSTTADPHTIARARPPRFIARDGIVRPYNVDDADGQNWLKNVNQGQYYRDKYVCHYLLAGDEKVVIVSFSRIILVNLKMMTTEWEVRFEDLTSITMERTGLALVLRGGVQGPFVPIPKAQSRSFIYKELGIAVNEFNKKFQANSGTV